MQHIILTKNKFGQKIWLDANEAIGKAIIKQGIYDEHAIESIETILKSIHQPICFDIGANIGNHALVMTKFSKKVYCFEPQTEVVELLKKTFAENEIKNVEIFCLGLSDKNEELTFYKNLDGHGGSSTFNADLKGNQFSTEKLTCVIGDELVQKIQLEKVDFIKIDVEGFEARSLLGLKETIKKFRPIVMMEWNNRITKEQFKQFDLFNTVFKDYHIRSMLHTHHKYYWGKPWYARLGRFFYRKFAKKKYVLHHFNPENSYTNILLFPSDRQYTLIR